MKTRLVGLILAMAGCAGSGGAVGGSAPVSSGAAAEGSAAECVTGTVGVESRAYAPRTVVRVAGGETTVVEGAQASRIRRLTGAVVTVCGTSAAGVMDAEIFEIRHVDGMEAHLGVVATGSEQVALDPGAGRAPVPLASVPEALRAADGQVAWVAGRWEGGRFQVLSFGLLGGD